jgi:hypothetical protein
MIKEDKNNIIRYFNEDQLKAILPKLVLSKPSLISFLTDEQITVLGKKITDYIPKKDIIMYVQSNSLTEEQVERLLESDNYAKVLAGIAGSVFLINNVDLVNKLVFQSNPLGQKVIEYLKPDGFTKNYLYLKQTRVFSFLKTYQKIINCVSLSGCVASLLYTMKIKNDNQKIKKNVLKK